MSVKNEEVIALLEQGKIHIQKGWCKHHYAKDKQSRLVHPTAADAAAYCIVGSLRTGSSSTESVFQKAVEILEATTDVPNNRSISFWNDYIAQTKEEVLDAMDRAITYVKNQG